MMIEKSPAKIRFCVVWFVAGGVAGFFVPSVFSPHNTELPVVEASCAISNLIGHYEREMHILVVAPGINRKGFEAYVNSNYQDMGARLFSTTSKSSDKDNTALQNFLIHQKIHIQLPAHLYVRKSEGGFLIKVDSQRGTWVIRKQESTAELSIVGLK